MLKCSKEAFAACPTRHLCGCPEEATFTEGSECDMFNRQIGSHVMTHADQIRAMSDEELAAYWSDHYDDFCPNLPECGEMLNQDQEIPAEKCIGCALRWLQEVEP